MITGWLLKMVLTIFLVGFALVEAGSPLVTRAQLDDVAHDAADNAALDLLAHRDADRARATAQEIASEQDATLKDFAIDSSGKVRVTVEREARSFLLKKWDRTKGWYDVEVTATSTKEGT